MAKKKLFVVCAVDEDVGHTNASSSAPPVAASTPSASASTSPLRSWGTGTSAAGFASQAQVRVTDSLLPQIAADFGTTVGAAAMVVTTYVIAHGSIQLLIGPVGDRFGKYLAITVMSPSRVMGPCLQSGTPPRLAAVRRRLYTLNLCTAAPAGNLRPVNLGNMLKSNELSMPRR